LRRHGRLGWATEEFEAFVRKAVADDAAVERWRRVKGLGGLDRRGLAIARGAPSKIEDLQALRGLPRGEQESILEAVRRARALPPDEFPEVEARDNDP